MVGLTWLGIAHTSIGVIAVVAGVASLFRDGGVSTRSALGRVYVWTTVVTCVTGFGIFQHGGFDKAHGLGAITLVVLVVAWSAGARNAFGRASRYVEQIGYSLTLFFHLVPGLTETGTRLPLGRPVFSSADDPLLQRLIGAAFVLFLVIAALQVVHLRRSPLPMPVGRGT